MMLRNLLNEVIRRRLWPIALVALLVAVAAPLLFLKSAPPGAPLASVAAPSVAPAGDLPARAQRLLTGGDAGAAGERRPRSRRSDPFQGPSSDAGSEPASGTGVSSRDTTTPGSDSSPGAQAGVTGPSTPATEPATPQSPAQPDREDAPSTATRTRLVDVRFGERRPARMYRSVARLQSFEAEGRIVAIFVKYSPTRDKAVFAIAPGTRIEGQIECRRKEGLCRYVDIPAGEGVRLTTRGSDGTPVTRRLDVHRIARPSQSGTAATASNVPADGSCLLGRMLALRAGDVPVAGDACNG